MGYGWHPYLYLYLYYIKSICAFVNNNETIYHDNITHSAIREHPCLSMMTDQHSAVDKLHMIPVTNSENSTQVAQGSVHCHYQ